LYLTEKKRTIDCAGSAQPFLWYPHQAITQKIRTLLSKNFKGKQIFVTVL